MRLEIGTKTFTHIIGPNWETTVDAINQNARADVCGPDGEHFRYGVKKGSPAV